MCTTLMESECHTKSARHRYSALRAADKYCAPSPIFVRLVETHVCKPTFTVPLDVCISHAHVLKFWVPDLLSFETRALKSAERGASYRLISGDTFVT